MPRASSWSRSHSTRSTSVPAPTNEIVPRCVVARSIRVAMVVIGASPRGRAGGLRLRHPENEDGHVVPGQGGLEIEGGLLDAVGDGLGAEIPAAGDELAQALMPEDRLAAASLGDPIGVEDDDVAGHELDRVAAQA